METVNISACIRFVQSDVSAYRAYCKKLTFPTSGRDGSLVLYPRLGTTDAVEHFKSLCYFINNGNFQPGDYLVMDNAKIHNAALIQPVLRVLCALRRINLVFLPTYSPELNPIELVFAQAKRYLRTHRNERRPFWVELLRAFNRVTSDNIKQYIKQCIKLKS